MSLQQSEVLQKVFLLFKKYLLVSLECGNRIRFELCAQNGPCRLHVYSSAWILVVFYLKLYAKQFVKD